MRVRDIELLIRRIRQIARDEVDTERAKWLNKKRIELTVRLKNIPLRKTM